MVSFDPSADAGMPLDKLKTHPSNWLPEMLSVKPEPMDEENFIKEQNSSFYSEGFQSASSNGTSPDSLDDKEPLQYYQNLHLKHKINLTDEFKNPQHLSSLVNVDLKGSPDSKSHIETIDIDDYYSSQSFSSLNLNSTPELKPTNLISKPADFINEPANTIRSSSNQPISPPLNEGSCDILHDSGFEGAMQNKPDEEMREEEQSEKNEEEPGLRTPAVNSHGKIKQHRCKQCHFVALTKFEFWKHVETHIKPDKRIYCKKCPFVTEFKHHLEYHVRNHMKIKPFKCSCCGYTCVNKSMLNSHLKSHSNIYQYRCANCSYATKYCHSLKQHLRKTEHEPDVVLNMDGTPNPLPIIDVYGTRRGPKQKPTVPKDNKKPFFDKNQQQQLIHGTPPVLMSSSPESLYSNYNPLLGAMLQPYMFGSNNNNIYQQSIANRVPEKVTDSTSQSILPHRLSYPAPQIDENMHALSLISPQGALIANYEPAALPTTLPAALDLTNTKTKGQASPPIQQPANLPTSPTAQLTPTKHRRKGRAFKLLPAIQNEENKIEKEENKIEKEENKIEKDENKIEKEENKTEKEENKTEKKDSSNSHDLSKHYMCQYCLIWFRDITMHTVHMGFHGYNDPYMCNTCGKRSENSVEFFVHLTRGGHNN